MEVTRKEEINIIKKEGFEQTFSSYQHKSSMYRRNKRDIEYSLYKNKEYKRGDIVYVSDRVFRNDIKNSMLQKSRPAIVIQNDIGNYHSKYLIVCYISTRLKNNYLPTHVYIDDIGRIKNSTVMAENIQSVHKDHCKFIGRVEPELMEKIDIAIIESLGLQNYLNKIKQLEKDNLYYLNKIKQLEKDNLSLQAAMDKLNSNDLTQKEDVKSLPELGGLLRINSLEGKKHIFDISSKTISLGSLDKQTLVEIGTKEDVQQLIKELQEVINYI